MMNLNCETILDFYMHKNKKILCQIKVSPSKNQKIKNTCRCLTQQQWITFDKKLEKLINTTDDWNDEKCLKYNIKPNIEVKVQKSKLSFKYFYKCLGAVDECDGDVIEADYIFECLLDFKQNIPFPALLELQEYEPQTETSPDKLCRPLSYEPYTPSKKKYRADNIDTIEIPGIDYLDYNDDTYSPKPIFKKKESETLLTEKIPRYIPALIRDTRNSRESNTPTQRDLPSSNSRERKKSSKVDLQVKVIVETRDEIDSSEKIKTLRSKSNKRSKKRQIEYIPKSQEYTVVDVPVYIPTPIEETTQRKVTKTDYDIRKHKKRSNTIDEFSSLLIDENSRETNKTIKEHISSKHKHSHYDNVMFKSRSKTIDEIPEEFSLNIERAKSKNLPEESKEKLCKQLESIDKSTFHKSKEKKNDSNQNISSTKEKSKQSEKKTENIVRESSSSEVEFLVAMAKSKKSSLSHHFEDGKQIDTNTKLYELNDNASYLNIYISSVPESATDTFPQKVKRERKQKESPCDDNISLRRSERSPSKPVRFIEEQHDLLRGKKPRKPKISPKNKELFGTDDDDDEEFFENNNDINTNNDKKVKSLVFENPVIKKSGKSASSSPSSSTKKTRRDKSSECEPEKLDVNKWWSKKKSSTTDNVEIMSLESVPVENILNTFSIYKSELDEIYKEN